ncbi:MAG: MFS transporter, partial [Maioricimonas sp. JB049]
MATIEATTPAADVRPKLFRDASFWGIGITQFLGAFNDNLFKQLVLFVCVLQAVGSRADNAQGTAMLVFAIPFVALSGFSGFLADRYSKKTIIVISKLLEVVVMTLGLLAFLSGSLNALFAVLFCMGAQSALFGPSKYGILPELFRQKDLPRANGWFLMTTFMAIIFGVALAGTLMETFRDQIWIAAAICITIAVVGTISAFFVRTTPVAQPGLAFRPGALFIPRETRSLLRARPRLLKVLVVTSLFWCTGAVYQLAVNDIGILQLEIGEKQTGY